MKQLLYAFGDVPDPLPETVRVLDEIVTDFIIETCHQAARAASVSGRQKIKVEDFRWAIRGDEQMLGRVKELLGMEKELKEARKHFDTQEGRMGLERGNAGGGGGGGGSGVGGGGGRKRKFKEVEDSEAHGVDEKPEGG